MNRGQAHTLEALTAGLVLLAGVVFAIQSTAVTPLSASTSNQHVETQQRATANTLLSVADENGTLHRAVLDWNTSDGAWVGAPEDGVFASGGPPNAFGAAINETFVNSRVAVNVEVVYRTGNGRSGSEQLVFMGSPSDNAVSATHTVVVHDGDTLPGGTTVASAAAAGEFYMPDAATNSTLFNVAEVRIVVWQI